MAVSFSKQDVLQACSVYGPTLQVPDHLDGRRVMEALASNESSLGFDCGPRYESAYDVCGYFYEDSKSVQLLVAKFGRAAACSYGPWQMMFDNFQTEDPDRLNSDLDLCAQEFVRWFNHWVIGVRKASSLAEIGEVWNTGHITPDPAYVAKLEAAYQAAV